MLRLGNAVRAAAPSKATSTLQKVAWFASDNNMKGLPPDNTVKASGGGGNNQRWWRPDPMTGVWIPEEAEGQVDAVELREQQYRLRTEATASLDERAWWSSMEEVPERSK